MICTFISPPPLGIARLIINVPLIDIKPNSPLSQQRNWKNINRVFAKESEILWHAISATQDRISQFGLWNIFEGRSKEQTLKNCCQISTVITTFPMLCYAMLCYAMQCYTILFYTQLYYKHTNMEINTLNNF